MSFDLTRFDVGQTIRCEAALRAAAGPGASVQAVAQAVCHFLYDTLAGADGERACALVRFYLTHSYRALPPNDRGFADRFLRDGAAPADDLQCLTLLGTYGDLSEWQDRQSSRGHRAIPLPTAAAIERAPMIAELFRQLGVRLSSTSTIDPVEPARRTYNVFHVEQALGSPYIPAQEEFVKPYGIESVVGFGGSVPWDEHFAVILFSRAHVSAEVASRFKSLTLAVKSRLLRFSRDDVFDRDREMVTAPPVVAPAARANRPRIVSRSSARPVDLAPQRFRHFVDARGTEWQVWEITPFADTSDRDDKSNAEVYDRLTTPSRPTARSAEHRRRWEGGWLLFEAAQHRRRLSPIPDQWFEARDSELREMCDRASPTAADRGGRDG